MDSKTYSDKSFSVFLSLVWPFVASSLLVALVENKKDGILVHQKFNLLAIH